MPLSSREANRRLSSSRRRAGLRAEGIRSRVFPPPPPPLELPGRPGACACAPAPSPGGRRASDSCRGDGPRGKPGGWGRGVACTWPLSAAQAGKGGPGPPPAPKERRGRGASCLARPPARGRSGIGRGNLPPHRSGGDASGGRAARCPFPSCAGPAPPAAALSSCRKFQKLSIIPAQRAAQAAKAPRRRATCRPADRAARPRPHPVPLD